jgi:hypothetical protein
MCGFIPVLPPPHLYAFMVWTKKTLQFFSFYIPYCDEEDRKCTYNVSLWCVRLMFIPLRLSLQPGTITLEVHAFTWISCRRKQNKRVCVFMWSPRYFHPILTKFWLYRQESPLLSNFSKLLAVGASLTHADRRTDMTKLIAAFGYYANVRKKYVSLTNTLCDVKPGGS